MTNADNSGAGNTRWYREPYAWLVFAIPAIAVVSGISMLVISRVYYDGVVVDDYYRRGLAIDRDLERDQRAASLGISARLHVTSRDGTQVDISPGSWRALDQVDLALVHPTRPGLDQHVQLRRHGEHRYAGPGMHLEAGHWHVEISANGWRLRGRLAVPGDGRLRLGAAGPEHVN